MKNMRKWINYLLVLSSFIFLFSLFWYRFLRLRLPRDIPFDLSLLGFIVLISLCISSALSIIYILIDYKPNNMITKIYEYTYKPLKVIIMFLINNKVTSASFIKNFMLWKELMKKLNYFYLYQLTELLPKTIIVIILFIDIFYFNTLNYFYKSILLGIIILITKYIFYVFKCIMNNNIEHVEEKSEIYCHNIINYEEPGVIIMLSAKDFVHEQSKRILNNMEIIDYFPSYRIEFAKKLRKLGKLKDNEVIDTKKFKVQIYESLNLAVSLYSIIYLYEKEQNKYKYVTILISSLYFICWSYILIVSIHTLTIDWEIFMNVKCIEEPFAQLDIDNNFQEKKTVVLIKIPERKGDLECKITVLLKKYYNVISITNMLEIEEKISNIEEIVIYTHGRLDKDGIPLLSQVKEKITKKNTISIFDLFTIIKKRNTKITILFLTCCAGVYHDSTILTMSTYTEISYRFTSSLYNSIEENIEKNINLFKIVSILYFTDSCSNNIGKISKNGVTIDLKQELIKLVNKRKLDLKCSFIKYLLKNQIINKSFVIKLQTMLLKNNIKFLCEYSTPLITKKTFEDKEKTNNLLKHLKLYHFSMKKKYTLDYINIYDAISLIKKNNNISHNTLEQKNKFLENLSPHLSICFKNALGPSYRNYLLGFIYYKYNSLNQTSNTMILDHEKIIST